LQRLIDRLIDHSLFFSSISYRRMVNPETLCVNVNLSSKRQAVLDEDACQGGHGFMW
jgi:hypothetical protein